MPEPISMGLLLGSSAALSAGGGIISGLIQSKAARDALSAQLQGFTSAQEMLAQFQRDAVNAFRPFVQPGASAMNILQTRVYTTTEYRIATESQRVQLQSEIARLSEPTPFDQNIINQVGPGPRQSERAAALHAQVERDRLGKLALAQSTLKTFDETQAAVAPLLEESLAREDARQGRIDQALERINRLADIPASLAEIRAELETDPVFQFRREQGERAIGRAAAARGSFFSGAAIQALGEFSLQLTGEETDRAIQRRVTSLQAAQAGLTSELTARAAEIEPIQALAQTGLAATSAQIGAQAQATTGIAQSQIAAGQAAAQSSLQQGQIAAGTIGGITRDVGSLATLAALQGMFNKPTIGGGIDAQETVRNFPRMPRFY